MENIMILAGLGKDEGYEVSFDAIFTVFYPSKEGKYNP